MYFQALSIRLRTKDWILLICSKSRTLINQAFFVIPQPTFSLLKNIKIEGYERASNHKVHYAPLISLNKLAIVQKSKILTIVIWKFGAKNLLDESIFEYTQKFSKKDYEIYFMLKYSIPVA